MTLTYVFRRWRRKNHRCALWRRSDVIAAWCRDEFRWSVRLDWTRSWNRCDMHPSSVSRHWLTKSITWLRCDLWCRDSMLIFVRFSPRHLGRADVHRSAIVRHWLTQSMTWLHVPVERVTLSASVYTQRARQRPLVRVLHSMNLEMLQFAKLTLTTGKLTSHATGRAVRTTSGSADWRRWATWPTVDCFSAALCSLQHTATVNATLNLNCVF